MKREWDVIVAGLGVMGAAATRELARRGMRVLGIDRYSPPHAHGSSHGETRIIREAYFEHPLYVPLVRRAWRAWEALERELGRSLLRQCGLFTAGPADGRIVPDTLASAAAHGMSHEVLDATAARERFPMFTPDAGMATVFEARAGVLYAERCVQALLDSARTAGAGTRCREAVTAWRDEGDSVVVEVGGDEVRADRLVLATGPWIGELARGAVPARVTRQPFHWFDPVPGASPLSVDVCPVTLWEFEPNRFFYTLPDVGGGFKAAIHHEGLETAAESVDREVSEDERRFVRELLERFIPDAAGASRGDAVCLYTTTPDDHFVIDFHPASRRVIVASPCSGHGFKFAPVVGEAVADLATAGSSALDIASFRLSRFY